MSDQNATLRPDYYEKCTFKDKWEYTFKRNEQGKIIDTLVVERPLSLTSGNPMQVADFMFTASTSDTHHTFVGRIEHFSGFFMN